MYTYERVRDAMVLLAREYLARQVLDPARPTTAGS